MENLDYLDIKYCLLIFFFIFSCTKEKPLISERIVLLNTTTKTETLVIENNSSKTAYFKLNINGNGLNSFFDIVEYIKNMPAEFPNESLQRKAWRFVIQNYDFQIPICQQSWTQAPLVMLNSIGFGYAGDHAYLLYQIWRLLGLEARVWSLNGHNVAEVKTKNGWEMYDSALMVYYYDQEKNIVGAKELMQNPTLIKSSLVDSNLVLKEELNEQSSLIFRHSDSLAHIYGTVEDNVKFSWLVNNTNIEELNIMIPSNGKLFIPIKDEAKISTGNNFEIGNIYSNFMKLEIYNANDIIISQPLLLTSIYGDGEVILNGKKISVQQNQNLRIDIASVEDFPQRVAIHKVNSSLDMYYLISENAFRFSKENEIKLSGSFIDSLDIYLTNRW
jgi:hypothetical protein